MAVSIDSTSELFRYYSRYRLNKFEPILRELLTWAGTFDQLKGKQILELGPGNRLELLRFLSVESGANVAGVGKTIYIKKSPAIALVTDSDFQPFFQTVKAKSYDVIYSRYVFESNSYHPLLLVKHPAYLKAIAQNTISNPYAPFPSSIGDKQTVFKQAYRALKPGGIIISHLVKRKNSALTADFLATLKPKPGQIHSEDPKGLSSMVVVVK